MQLRRNKEISMYEAFLPSTSRLEEKEKTLLREGSRFPEMSKYFRNNLGLFKSMEYICDRSFCEQELLAFFYAKLPMKGADEKGRSLLIKDMIEIAQRFLKISYSSKIKIDSKWSEPTNVDFSISTISIYDSFVPTLVLELNG